MLINNSQWIIGPISNNGWLAGECMKVDWMGAFVILTDPGPRTPLTMGRPGRAPLAPPMTSTPNVTGTAKTANKVLSLILSM